MASSRFDPIDDEERALMDAIERGETRSLSVREVDAIKADIRSASHNITIRFSDADIEGMKAKAARMGLNYQTLIKTLVHRYLNGAVSFQETF
jgi:predicted DNA binding CopG/RHH family protein